MVFFYLTRPLLLGEAPPPPRLPLLRRGLQPVNRLFCTRKQAHAPSGLLVIINATELRLFYAIELRLSMRRGRAAAYIHLQTLRYGCLPSAGAPQAHR